MSTMCIKSLAPATGCVFALTGAALAAAPVTLVKDSRFGPLEVEAK